MTKVIADELKQLSIPEQKVLDFLKGTAPRRANGWIKIDLQRIASATEMKVTQVYAIIGILAEEKYIKLKIGKTENLARII